MNLAEHFEGLLCDKGFVSCSYTDDTSKAKAKFKKDDSLCHFRIFIVLSDKLFDIYSRTTHSKEMSEPSKKKSANIF